MKPCSPVIMSGVLFILIILFKFVILDEHCPSFITCETPITIDTCPQGTYYRENVLLHNCCPGCIKLKGESETCDFDKDCEPGLKCNSLKKCEGDKKQTCEFYKRYDKIYKKKKYWKPNCLADGTFAAKQCKGEVMSGKCFCVDKMGKRIFGESEWSKAQNMTCACSRFMDEMMKIKSDFSLHCDETGNYEPLQCTQDVCWCSSPKNGIPYTSMVPLEMIMLLPCYNKIEGGSQYFRQCDSSTHQQEVLNALLKNHGTIGISMGNIKCNFDGSYHRVQPFKDKYRCVSFNNFPLTEAVSSNDANCNCAYDRHIAQQQQLDFMFDCLPNGNYRTRQRWNGIEYCVDDDGFHYSDDPKDCPVV